MSNDYIQTSFSIKDLENLSGVKAHTIRIWEKRYSLLEPQRTDTNIRTYDIHNLQKLLNIALLNQNGYKISKIAQLDEKSFQETLLQEIENKYQEANAINNFKLAMLHFDQSLFDEVYDKLMTEFSFQKVFLDTFLPFLDEIGLLWQTNTITPAHEHFVSNLIQQKILLNINETKKSHTDTQSTFVLFLPLNEIHELGLLFLHYELCKRNLASIYLGASVPMENLVSLQAIFPQITFVSYFTIEPKKQHVKAYLQQIDSEILTQRQDKLVALGRNIQEIDPQGVPQNVKIYQRINDFLDQL